MTDVDKLVDRLKHHPLCYTFGNGGSAAIANHMECDWTKSTGGKVIAISLVANTSMLTAIANDLGYDQTCVAQLRWRVDPSLNPNIVLVSSSGNSPNIVRAAEWAKYKGLFVIGFTGFDGGQLKKLADISIHKESNDYGIVEDYHSNVMHEVVRRMK